MSSLGSSGIGQGERSCKKAVGEMTILKRLMSALVMALAIALAISGQASAQADPPAISAEADAVDGVATAPADSVVIEDTPVVVGKAVPPTEISVGGCGFLRSCVYFNKRDQQAIIAGGAAGVIATLCLSGGPAVCIVGSAIVAAAGVYLSARGICSNNRYLRVQWLPSVGNLTCTVND